MYFLRTDLDESSDIRNGYNDGMKELAEKLNALGGARILSIDLDGNVIFMMTEAISKLRVEWDSQNEDTGVNDWTWGYEMLSSLNPNLSFEDIVKEMTI